MTEIIAEIGFNHEGDMARAEEMIRAAAQAGADAVKFQTFRAEDIALPSAAHFQAVRAGEMDLDMHRRLFDAASAAGVEFLSTPFSRWAVDLLETIGVRRYKIASMDLINFDLLEYVARTGKPVVLSSGMGTLAEIGSALEFLFDQGAPSVTLLHCISQYPSRAEELNLHVIPFLKETFGIPVGYSDHFPGIQACLMAAVLGADVIETHFTLDNTLPGADHNHSATPAELEELVRAAGFFQTAAGSREELVRRTDRDFHVQYRRGLYAARDLSAGEVLDRESLIATRPQNSLFTPNDLRWLIGRRLKAGIGRFEPLSWSHI